MTYNKTTINILFCLHFFLSAPAGEHREVSSRVRNCIMLVAAQYEQDINKELLAIAQTNAPLELYEKIGTYYYEQQRKVSWRTSLKDFVLNLKKIPTYFAVSADINKAAYAETTAALLEQQHTKALFNATHLQQIEAVKKEQWQYEWPLESIKPHLEKEITKAQQLKKWLKNSQSTWSIVEQQTTPLKALEDKIDITIAQHTKAIALINYRKEIIQLNKDPVQYLTQKAQEKMLPQTLQELTPWYPLSFWNDLFRNKTPQKNSLLHELCRAHLTSSEFQQTLALVVSPAISLNAQNMYGQTVLDYASSYKLSPEHLKAIIKSGGTPQRELQPILRAKSAEGFEKTASENKKGKKMLNWSADIETKKT